MPKVFQDENAFVKFAVAQVVPEWQGKLFKKHAEEIQVHSKGELFYKIDQLFPNEQMASKQHRLLAFEPITQASFWKGLNNIVEIFQNSSYSATASEKTVEYIIQHNWHNKNLFSYFLDHWTQSALAEDPNSIIAVYPFEYIQAHPERDQIVFIPSEYLKYNKDGMMIFTSIEESEKKIALEDLKINGQIFYDNTINRENIRLTAERTYSQKVVATVTRAVIHAFTEEGFWRMEQDEKDSKTYNWEFFPYKNKFVSATTVGGLPAEDKSVKQSFFYGCVPMGNLALLQHSQHTAVNFTYSFPRMSELETACTNDLCQNGFVLCERTEQFPEGKCPCPKCGGSGSYVNQTPYKVYRRKYDTSGTGDNEHLKVDDVRYYTPDTGILDYSKTEWRDYLEEFEKALYINQQVKTGDAVSAKSKEVDLKDKYSFLKRVAKVFYEKLRFVCQAYENFLNASPNEVTINTPFSFAIITEAEAFEALDTILNSNAPVLVKANQIDLYISKFISQSSPIRKAFDVLKTIDKLLYYSIDDITVLKSNSVVTREQWITHAMSYPVLMQLYSEDQELFKDPVKSVAEKVTKELEQYMAMPDTSLQATVLAKLKQQQPAAKP